MSTWRSASTHWSSCAFGRVGQTSEVRLEGDAVLCRSDRPVAAPWPDLLAAGRGHREPIGLDCLGLLVGNELWSRVIAPAATTATIAATATAATASIAAAAASATAAVFAWLGLVDGQPAPVVLLIVER